MRPQATQEIIARLPETTGEEFEAAIGAARDAFPAWRQTPVPTRARVMLKLQQLIRENMVRAAALRAAEQDDSVDLVACRNSLTSYRSRVSHAVQNHRVMLLGPTAGS